ncbi:hypothetical protein ACO0LG_29370 [Undibacterium sp. Ji42W]|uniref:hypothetical protein n=1 Tax=Undibacterium sp. Ji42W TaxID=3413039 RepID=UPI003BF29575
MKFLIPEQHWSSAYGYFQHPHTSRPTCRSVAEQAYEQANVNNEEKIEHAR